MKYQANVLMCLFLLVVFSSSAQAQFKVYIDVPSKCASHNSGAEHSPVCTLDEAKQLVLAAQPKTDIEIHIAEGRYYGQSVIWKYVPIHNGIAKKTTFMPKNNGIGKPHFDGHGNVDPFFSSRTFSRQPTSL